MSEDKNERFKRLASARTNEVIKRIRILGNCANKNVYSYSPDEVKKIFDAIEDEVRTVKAKFSARATEFRL